MRSDESAGTHHQGFASAHDVRAATLRAQYRGTSPILPVPQCTTR
jgi:hypothetical protein